MRKFKNIKICRKYTVIATMVTLPKVRFFSQDFNLIICKKALLRVKVE